MVNTLKRIEYKPTKKYPVVWQNQKFKGIEKFDCRAIRLINEWDNFYSTYLPISPLDYRKNGSYYRFTEDRARVEVKKLKHYTRFEIYDDWNSYHVIEIHNSLEKEINEAIKSAKEQELLK